MSKLNPSERVLFVAHLLGILAGGLSALGTLLRLVDRNEIPSDAPMYGSQPKEPTRSSYFDL